MSKTLAAAPASKRVGLKSGKARAPARKVAAKKAAKKATARHGASTDGQDLAGRAAQNTIAANPLLGIRAADLKLAAGALLKGAAGQPRLFMRHLTAYAGAMVDVARDKTVVEPDPKDKRFADPAWQSNPVYRRLMQTYLAHAAGARPLHRRHQAERASTRSARTSWRR